MGYSLFTNQDTHVYAEIFCFQVDTVNTVSVQRRFEVTEKWLGDMASMPVAPDRNHYGTPFVPSDVAVLLLQCGVLKIPSCTSWVVQYGGSGHYFSNSSAALDYCARRWPDAMALFNDNLHRGAPLEISESRKVAFEENKEKIQPWKDKADALAAQIRSARAALDEG